MEWRAFPCAYPSRQVGGQVGVAFGKIPKKKKKNIKKYTNKNQKIWQNFCWGFCTFQSSSRFPIE